MIRKSRYVIIIKRSFRYLLITDSICIGQMLLCAVGLHRFDQGLPIFVCLFTRIKGPWFDLKS